MSKRVVTIGVSLRPELLETIDRAVEEGAAESRSDLLRVAVRRYLTNLKADKSLPLSEFVQRAAEASHIK